MDAQSGANNQPQQSYSPPAWQPPPQPVEQPADLGLSGAPAQPEATVGQSAPSEPPQMPEQQVPDSYDTDEYGSDQYGDTSMLPSYLKPQVEEVVYSWQAPSRPFKQRNRRYFTTVITIALLISLILFFAGQFLPIAVVVAVAFLAYVMATIPPHQVTHQFTTFGIRMENELYYWEELGWFWFTTKHNERVLNIEVGRFPNRLMMVLGEAPEDDIRHILGALLIESTPPPTYYEKAAAWIQEKIPLDVD